MFSVEQLLANDTFDRMVCISDDIVRHSGGLVATAYLNSRECLCFETNVRNNRPSSILSTHLDLIAWWQPHMKHAFNTCVSTVAYSIARNRAFPRLSPLIPREVLALFTSENGSSKLSIELFTEGTLRGRYAYTFDGHAALCMWLTDSVSFHSLTDYMAFPTLRHSLDALTSIWSLAACQNAAVTDISSRKTGE